jgi:hypothetical protein
MNTEEARAVAEKLFETGKTWYNKASDLIEGCCTVLEDVDPEKMGANWTERNCSWFVDTSVNILIGAITAAVNEDFKQLEAYFLGEKELAENEEPVKDEDGDGDEDGDEDEDEDGDGDEDEDEDEDEDGDGDGDEDESTAFLADLTCIR